MLPFLVKSINWYWQTACHGQLDKLEGCLEWTSFPSRRSNKTLVVSCYRQKPELSIFLIFCILSSFHNCLKCQLLPSVVNKQTTLCTLPVLSRIEWLSEVNETWQDASLFLGAKWHRRPYIKIDSAINNHWSLMCNLQDRWLIRCQYKRSRWCYSSRTQLDSQRNTVDEWDINVFTKCMWRNWYEDYRQIAPLVKIVCEHSLTLSVQNYLTNEWFIVCVLFSSTFALWS